MAKKLEIEDDEFSRALIAYHLSNIIQVGLSLPDNLSSIDILDRQFTKKADISTDEDKGSLQIEFYNNDFSKYILDLHGEHPDWGFHKLLLMIQSEHPLLKNKKLDTPQ